MKKNIENRIKNSQLVQTGNKWKWLFYTQRMWHIIYQLLVTEIIKSKFKDLPFPQFEQNLYSADNSVPQIGQNIFIFENFVQTADSWWHLMVIDFSFF